MENDFLKQDVNKLGVNVPSAQDQFQRATEVIKEKLPHGIVPNGGLQWQMLNGLAESSFQETAQAQDVVTGALTLQSAIGVQVDNLLNPLGVYRRKATSTIVELAIENQSTEDQSIPAETLILNATTQDTYKFKTDALIPANSVENVNVECVTLGGVVCPVDCEWSLYQYFSWVKSINNNYTGSLGFPQETDFLYKYRAALYAGQQARSGSYEQIVYILDNQEHIENYQVYENTTFTTQKIEYKEGVTFDLFPCSYCIALKMKEEFNQDQYWGKLTELLGGNRIQVRMYSPDDTKKQVVVKVNRELSQNIYPYADHSPTTPPPYFIEQLFYANYILTLPKVNPTSPTGFQDNYFLGINVRYTRYSTTPPLNELTKKVREALYYNFYGVFEDNVPVPTPYRIFLGSTISADRFQVSLQALNIIGLETTPSLLQYDRNFNTNTWGVAQIYDNPIQTLITQNWRLLPELIRLVAQN